MDRERQIELMKTAEARTTGYLRSWIERDPAVRRALNRQSESRVTVRPHDEHAQAVR